MEALGRLINVAPIAKGAAISLKGASAVTFVCTGADTFTVTSSATAAGTYASPGTIIDHYYANAQTNGSAAWTRETQDAANAVEIAAGAAAFTVEAASLPDGDAYVKCAGASTGLVTAIVHDLTAQRAPELLPALGA